MITSVEALLVVSYMVVPGFLATHCFNAVVVREARDTTRMVVEWLAISMLFWVVCGPVIGGGLLAVGWDLDALDAEARSTAITQVKVYALLIGTAIAVLLPVVGGWGLGRIVGKVGLEDRLGIRPLHPRAWDEWFSRGESAYVIATMKNGDKVAGYYGPRSFASSYPNPEDLYIEAVVALDDDNNFAGGPDPHSAGVWVAGSEIRTLELFHPIEEAPDEQREQQYPERRVSTDTGTQRASARGIHGTEEASPAAKRVAGEAGVEQSEQQHHKRGEVSHEREQALERGIQARATPTPQGVSPEAATGVGPGVQP